MLKGFFLCLEEQMVTRRLNNSQLTAHWKVYYATIVVSVMLWKVSLNSNNTSFYSSLPRTVSLSPKTIAEQHISRWHNYSDKPAEQFWSLLFFNSGWQKRTIERSVLKMTLIGTIFPNDRSSEIWHRIAAATVSCNCHIKTVQENQQRIFRQSGPRGK